MEEIKKKKGEKKKKKKEEYMNPLFTFRFFLLACEDPLYNYVDGTPIIISK